jgi:hypothetical protein
LRNNRIAPSSEPDQLSRLTWLRAARSTEDMFTAKRFELGDFDSGLEQSVLNAELTSNTTKLSRLRQGTGSASLRLLFQQGHVKSKLMHCMLLAHGDLLHKIG